MEEEKSFLPLHSTIYVPLICVWVLTECFFSPLCVLISNPYNVLNPFHGACGWKLYRQMTYLQIFKWSKCAWTAILQSRVLCQRPRPLPMWNCATNAKGNPLWHRQALLRTHCEGCWYMICAGTELAQTLLLLHTHQPPLCEDITLLPFVKWVLSDVKWARRAAEYRGDELGRSCLCTSPTALCGFVCARSLLFAAICDFIHLHLSFSLCRENGEAFLLRMLSHYEIWNDAVNELKTSPR